MSIEVMKRIKSLLQDTKMIDSHTISAVVAECDMAILAKQPATGEPHPPFRDCGCADCLPSFRDEPATDEWKLVPVVPTEKMLLAYTGGAVTNAGFRWCRHQWSVMLAAAPAAHPAPSTPSLIEEAISSGHFGVLPMKATTLMCKAGWAASGGELTFQQIGHIYEEMYKARPLPDAAMPAAKEKP